MDNDYLREAYIALIREKNKEIEKLQEDESIQMDEIIFLLNLIKDHKDKDYFREKITNAGGKLSSERIQDWLSFTEY